MDRLLPLTGWIAAHHRDTDDDPPKAYPQLCLGFELDTPTVRTGPNAVNILTQLTGLGLPPGILAADRAYTNCTPATFQTPSDGSATASLWTTRSSSADGRAAGREPRSSTARSCARSPPPL
ncbi:hypothetical protein [Streptomyces marianii]|uniref:hypothetical protein n=1 Tax=Streptomyces marianii TaxID=1817406 RepID=UPI001F364D42|nr:hypothetical protein [Streptomyces marianii]